MTAVDVEFSDAKSQLGHHIDEPTAVGKINITDYQSIAEGTGSPGHGFDDLVPSLNKFCRPVRFDQSHMSIPRKIGGLRLAFQTKKGCKLCKTVGCFQGLPADSTFSITFSITTMLTLCDKQT